jgi:hypothetical protein
MTVRKCTALDRCATSTCVRAATCAVFWRRTDARRVDRYRMCPTCAERARGVARELGLALVVQQLAEQAGRVRRTGAP